MNKFPKARRSDIVVSETRDETLVYDLNTNKVFCLNDTCRKVWELCDGTRSVDQIGIDIDRKASPKYREAFVGVALKQLDENGLLEDKGFAHQKTSRREMMRTLGVAGAMALPLVTALTAPKAAYAQSTCQGKVCPGAQGGCCSTSVFELPICCGAKCCEGVIESCCNGTCILTGIDQCCGTTSCNVDDICCGDNCCTPGEECCDGNCCTFDEFCVDGVCVALP